MKYFNIQRLIYAILGSLLTVVTVTASEMQYHSTSIIEDPIHLVEDAILALPSNIGYVTVMATAYYIIFMIADAKSTGR